MKRYLTLILMVAALLIPSMSRAQQPTFAQIGGGSANQPGCSGAPNFGGAMWCFDNSQNATMNIYSWNGSKWIVAAGPASDISIIAWDGALGGMTSTAVTATLAPCTGHFTELVCTATLTGACTTGPTINVGDVTASTAGTAVSPTTVVATLAKQVETLAFTVGDTIALQQTATVSSCTAPSYACNATYTCP